MRISLAALLAGLVLWGGAGTKFAARAEVTATEPQRIVLVLDSFNAGFQWTDSEVDGIREVFSAVPGVRVTVEYMDDEAATDRDAYYRKLTDLLDHKYAGVEIDVVIAIDDPAIRYLQAEGKRIFPGVPIVVSGAHQFSVEDIAALGNATGIHGGFEIASTVDLILDLHPNTQRIYIIDEGPVSGNFLRSAMDEAMPGFRDRVEFTYLQSLSMPVLRSRLGALPKDSAVLYLSYAKNGPSQPSGDHEAIPRISRSSTAPVYGPVSYMLGYGVVGGYMQSGRSQGVIAGRIAARILTGSDPKDIPVVEQNPHHYRFDFRQLARFGISLSGLPSNSEIIEEPDTFYYRYKHLLWPTVIIFALMAFYIVQLRISITKRKKAQRGLQRILDQGSRMFNLESLEAFSTEIRNRLSEIVRPRDEIMLFKYMGLDGAFDRGKLSAVVPGGGYAMVGDASKSPLPDRVVALVQRAVEQRRCLYDGREMVVLFDNPNVPINLAFLRSGGRADAIDQRLVEVFARDVATEVDNIESYRLSESLANARQIQSSMLPKDFARVATPFGVDLHAMLLPAKHVSGDLYDFFAVDDERLCVVVGDVSDKGVPSALFMSMTKTLIRAAAETLGTPDRILSKVNAELCRDNEQMMFVTLFLGIYHRGSGRLDFVNAGHNRPYVLSADGSVATVQGPAGMALGVLDVTAFACGSVSLDHGDTIAVYTDGVTEAVAPGGELFGEDRLTGALGHLVATQASRMTEAVVQDVERFAAGSPQADDITLLCLRRL